MKGNANKYRLTLVLPSELHQRLSEMRWRTRAASLTELICQLLQDSVDQDEEKSALPAGVS